MAYHTANLHLRRHLCMLSSSCSSFTMMYPSSLPSTAFLSPLALSSNKSSVFQSPSPCSSLSHQRRSSSASTPTYTSTSTRALASGRPALRPRIAIVGGGHAGLSTALRLSSLPWTRLTKPSITLIDRSDRFVFLPMLYELALSQVSQWEVAPKYEDLLSGTGIQFVHANVENLDMSSLAVEGSTTISTGPTPKDRGEESGKDTEIDVRILFDKAVLAVGGEAANLDRVPGAKDYALPFYKMDDALRLKERLAELLPTGTTSGTGPNGGKLRNVVVVGGGFSGVELAACIADMYGSRVSVLLIETSSQILNSGTAHNRRVSERALMDNGVSVVYNSRVTRIGAADVEVDMMKGDDVDVNSKKSSTTYPADLVLWTAGTKASSSHPGFGVELDKAGRVATDTFLQVRGHEDVLYAVGDGASSGSGDSIDVYNGGYHGTAQVAVQQAEYAAWNAWADITGKRKLRYRYTQLGEMMLLGKDNATVSTVVGLDLEGQPAWVTRRLAYLARMPTEKQRRRVAASWALHPVLRGLGNLVSASQKYRNSSSGV